MLVWLAVNSGAEATKLGHFFSPKDLVWLAKDWPLVEAELQGGYSFGGFY